MPYNRQDGWWKRRSKLERQLSYISLTLLAITLIFIAALAFYIQYGRNRNVCLTKECVLAASGILENVDRSSDPCDNFYRFACGNLKDHATISDDERMYTSFVKMASTLNSRLRALFEDPVRFDEIHPVQMVKRFYASCMDQQAIEEYGLDEAKTLLNALGGWPVLEEIWDPETFDWAETLSIFKERGLSFHYLLQIAVDNDARNTNQRMIHIQQPSFGLSREFLIQGVNSTPVKAYYELMVDFALMLGPGNGNLEFKATDELLDVLNFEISLAKQTVSVDEIRDKSKFYNIMTFLELKQQYGDIPWEKLMTSIFPEKVKFYDERRFNIDVPQYVEGLEKLIKNTPRKTIANYLLWRAVFQIRDFLPQKFLDRLLKFKHIYSGINQNPPRWKFCLNLIKHHYDIIAGAMYVRKHFDGKSKELASDLVQYILEEFKNYIDNHLDWMDEKTKERAAEKAKAIIAHIAYPEELLDDHKLEKYYEGVDVNEKVFLQSFLNINKLSVNKSINRILEPVNKTNWEENTVSIIINAFYSPKENAIFIPAAFMQELVFSKDRPNYMNFGQLGTVIGHEITHGFDDQGSQYDKEGNLINWWEDDSKKSFVERTQCFVNQYSSYNVTEISRNINGLKTQGENIADCGGVKHAYLAYNLWVEDNGEEDNLPGLEYTPKQLFWIANAQLWCTLQRKEDLDKLIVIDVHSPAEYRIVGPFSNLQDFSKDFNCPMGSNMNPKDRKSVV